MTREEFHANLLMLGFEYTENIDWYDYTVNGNTVQMPYVLCPRNGVANGDIHVNVRAEGNTGTRITFAGDDFSGALLAAISAIEEEHGYGKG